MHEAHFGLLVSTCIALFGSFISHATVCAERHACLSRGTCYSMSKKNWFDPSCSFRTTVTPAGFKLLNASVQFETMQLMNRGVCSPGSRQQVDSVTGVMICTRKRSWPDAFLAEIGDPTADTDHGRYCGRWIAAGSFALGSLKWAWYDWRDTERDVDNLVLAKGASRMATTDLGKFRSTCRTMVASNSAGASAKQAYELLTPEISVASMTTVLESIGFLASHYCDAPALVGVGLVGDKFVSRVTEGVVLTDNELKNSLYVVGEDRAMRNNAAEFANAMRGIAHGGLSPTTSEQASVIVKGSYRATWLEDYISSSFENTHAHLNDPLERFVGAFVSHGPIKAYAYLKGVAAVCSLAAQAVVVPEMGNLLPAYFKQPKISAANSRASAFALGRLASPGDEADDIDEYAIMNASTIRLSDLYALSYSSRGSARDVCLSAAKRVFPDAFDHIAFDALVTPTLYARLNILTEEIREAAALTLADDLIGNTFEDYADRMAAVAKIRATRVRIAGAPRGTWAGITREFHPPNINSEDSALSMIIKQARAVFLDRLLPVVQDADICDHPAIFAGVSRNAYLLGAHSPSTCSMILPGLIVPPFADERYNNVSLMTRLGFVVAHEFMHVTASVSQWNQQYTDPLLRAYPSSTNVEAIADLGATASLMRINYVTNDTLCAAASQLFCGRVGWANSVSTTAYSHPPTNMRGDNICQFLRIYFAN